MTVRRLHLLRHAKSSWDDPSLADHDRPLAPRGRKAARLLSDSLATLGVAPDLVVCSPAARARGTLELLAPALGAAETVIDDAVYHGAPGGLLAIVHALPATAREVLLIGHNPGLQDLCVLLAAPSPERDRVSAKLPTCTLATLEVTGEWTDAGPGSAVLRAVVAPRDLA